jgi:TPR repeat protein
MKKVLFILVIFIAQLQALTYNIKDINACSKGDSLACNRIGILYESGDSVKKNHQKAKRYYKKSCEFKFGNGCQNLAQMLTEEGNYSKAAKYYSEGCDFNNADACSNFALLFEKGKGVELNYSHAKKYHGKACDLGNEKSCKSHAYLNRNGVI